MCGGINSILKISYNYSKKEEENKYLLMKKYLYGT